MKYLLIALMIMPNGDAQGLVPETWNDSERECQVKGEELREFGNQQGADAVHFDCIGLNPLDMAIMKYSIENELAGR